MSKKRNQPKAQHAHGRGHDDLSPEERALLREQEHDEERIHVPKGQSRLRFFLILGLLLFVLVIFVVPSAFVQSFVSGGGGGDIPDYMVWESPDGTTNTLSGQDFMQQKRDFDLLEIFGRDPQSSIFSILGVGQVDTKDDEHVAQLLVMEDVARSAGIRITDEDLADVLLRLFGSEEVYLQAMASRRGLSAKSFEESLRRVLGIQRLQGMLSAGVVEADPAEIEELWKASHQEYAFDYAVADTAAFEDDARAQLPDDAGLQAWFDALPAFEKNRYQTPQTYGAEIAWVDLGGDFDATALLERFPRPEEEVPAEIARAYYDTVFNVRFERDEPLPEEEAEGRDRFYVPYAEVEDVCLREAPIYRSMLELQADLSARAQAPDETVDLKAEADALGLRYDNDGEARTFDAWRDIEAPYAGRNLAAGILGAGGAGEGTFVRRLTVEKGAMSIARVTEIRPPALPPFPDIRERVADAWVKKKRTELATAALEAVRDALGERPTEEGVAYLPTADADAFAAAAEAAGFTVAHRDFEERFAEKEPVEDEALQAAEDYLRSSSVIYGLDEGQVAAAGGTPGGERVYLVRAAGARDSDLAKMRPRDLQSLRSSLGSQAVRDFMARTFKSKDYLKREFNMRLYVWENPREGEPQPGA